MLTNLKVSPESIPNSGIRYVDHGKNNRSGHLGHGLVEYRKGCILSFYSNCSATRNGGHNGFGWMEYRRSTDSGLTWGEPEVLPYSWNSFLNETFTVSCEKAVSTCDDRIIAFFARCCNPNGWEPYLEPTVVISSDGGETWGEPELFCNRRGRIYDALVADGSIYVLFHAAPDWPGQKEDEKFYLYRSDDEGAHFELQGELPFDPVLRAYGSMVLREDGDLVCYIYNIRDEYNLDYCISRDMGKTWTEIGKSFCPKRIRNPQVTGTKGGYLLHGRSGCLTNELPPCFFLYTSPDGIHWDEGVYLCEIRSAAAYYSNNLVLDMEDGTQRVLIQSSIPQSEWGAKVDIAHWIIEVNGK